MKTTPRDQVILKMVIKEFSLAIEHASNDIGIYINRCIDYEMTGNMKLALQDAEKAHSMEPTNPGFSTDWQDVMD